MLHLARTFQRALGLLSSADRARARRAAMALQESAEQPGAAFQRIVGAPDRDLWALPVGPGLQIAVHHAGDALTLCFVGPPEAVGRWARGHRVEEHPTTGAMQVVQISRPAQPAALGDAPLGAQAAASLLAMGVPADRVDWLQSAGRAEIVDGLAGLPEAARERVMALLSGSTPRPTPAPGADPLDHPDAARDFAPIDSARALEQALDAPLETWRIFLHPDQRALVERAFNGPARVYGSAGTGKTVVALHRARWLAERGARPRILLTSYNTPLAADLERRLAALIGGPPARLGISVEGVHALARRLYTGPMGQTFSLASDDALDALLAEGLRDNPRAAGSFDVAYVRSEWDAFVDPLCLRDRDAYLATPRDKRGRSLGKLQKSRLWKVFAHALAELDARGLRTWHGLCADVAAWLDAHPDRRPFDHAIVDEVQDLAHAELIFVRALVAPGPDDLFLCGDAGQRLYGRRSSWLGSGVDIRGRSRRLLLNYRTTEQIRALSEALLPAQTEGPEGDAEPRAARSVRRGPSPVIHPCASDAEQVDALAAWLRRALDDGLAPAEIAIFARTRRRLSPARRACERAGVPTVEIRELTPGGGPAGGAGAVRLGTMHASKGLEFRAVAVVGCDDRALPMRSLLARAADRGDALELEAQERNLLYVATTRARDRLLLTFTGDPSPFLQGLAAEYAEPDEAPTSQEPPGSTAGSPPPFAAEDDPPGWLPPDDVPLPRTAFKISPSRVAGYFGFSCQRFLRWDAAWTDAQKAADARPTDAPSVNPLQQAIFQSGFDWEERALAGLPEGSVLIAPGDGPISERFFTVTTALEAIRTAKPGQYIYELKLRAPEKFYARYGIDHTRVTFSDNRPDLIQVLAGEDGGTVLRVVDMKRGDHLKTTYRVQVLLYALQLRDVLDEHKIAGVSVDMERGGVWLGDHPEPTLFSLRAIEPHVARFLREELPVIVSAPPREIRWHVNYRCEWCPYLKTCWAEMEATDDVSRLPRLTHRGKQFLRDEGLTTIAALDAALQDPALDTDALLGQAPSLAVQRHLLGPRARALTAGDVVPQGAAARGMTRPTDREVRIFLTLQRESLGRTTYLMGYRIERGDAVPDHVAYRAEDDARAIVLAEGPEQLDSARRRFVVELFGALSRIDAYNLGQAWAEQLSVQFFVYSAAEERLLNETLFTALAEPETAAAAGQMLMYFQGPDLLLARQHPADHVALPITVLLDALGRSLALPVPVSYTLPESLAALGADCDYPRDPDFHLPLSPTLRSERLYDAWHGDAPQALPQIRAHAERYLGAVSSLFQALRERAEAAGELHFYMPKFSLPLARQLRDPLLSRMAFLAQYESALGCREIRDRRMTARRAVRYTDAIHELEALGDGRFRILDGEPTLLEPGAFPNWLLARDTPAGRRAQLQYNDYYYREKLFRGLGRRHPALAVASIGGVETGELGFAEALQLNTVRPFDGDPPKAGERFLLYDRFSDGLVGRTLAFIEQLEARGPGFFQRLLTRPEALAGAHPWPADVAGHLAAIRDDLGLTPSQGEALGAISGRRVLALWGPPGTGKTWFLATTILALLEAHRRAGRRLRVLVTAFTHAAAENVLLNLLKRMSAGILDEPLQVAKGGSWKGANRPKAIRVVPAKGVPGWLDARDRCVLGGTIWAIDRHLGAAEFDLVVVDEASQVRVPDAAISVGVVAPEGRVIFAGDHLQLPPIVKGTYPEPAEGEIVLHRSIFEAVCGLLGGRFLRQLQENFRMNETLTGVSARLLYGAGYRSGSPEVAEQRLLWAPLAAHDPLVRACLDPEAPLVVGLLKGLPPGKDNEIEARLVAELTFALREGLRDADGGLFADDAGFFSRGVFIVSPHHSQIHRVRRCLDAPARRAWGAEPFVGTVDKMQGQEAQAVIVTYGVSDPEYAAREAEFIYSLNRLNVSITRGRSKTVLLLSEALLEASPQVLERERAEQGLGYMRGLVELVQREGQVAAFFPGDGVEIAVWSLRAGSGGG